MNVHGVHGGKRVSGAVKVGRREGSSGEGSFLGAARVVGGRATAARRLQPRRSPGDGDSSTRLPARYSDAELDELFEGRMPMTRASQRMSAQAR